MPLAVLLATIAVALVVPLIGWAALTPRLYQNKVAEQNLSRGLIPPAAADAERGQRLSALARRFTPGRFVARLDRLLVRAGRPPAWPMKRLLSAKVLLAGTGLVLGFLFVSGDPGAVRLLLASLLVIVAYFVPDLLLYSKGTERQTAIALALPDTLDQMTIAVEAGLGFEAAMARAAYNGKGALAQELVRTLQDMQVGRSRREAYMDLADRTTVVDLRRFVRSIIQADLYGISISGVLRTQAAEMRLKRRQRAEEKAMEIPVKVLFPLMFCILPVLFIVLLGPAAIGIIDTLNK
ncbi:type II secretion system F family protein [Paenarthrobacter sp. Z7-10]|uniref:type II secretion system F family protein n=1 Tax=Paenarthrobacter sp. Z7-10 TaxID=2787635 RepID=UPI0022A8EFD0|nr:type II secretion system F family protein [Paenarthrobacter sp. Z7-10]MCZ2402566.1 type II secretion system F family protein [Paenarthrobacter sp. Z7-10]